MRHHPAGHVPSQAPRVTELADDSGNDEPLHGHVVLDSAFGKLTISQGAISAARTMGAGSCRSG